ncbi:MAG: hypothetical protein J2P38_04285, partial [Candidatus Dormibacteraeota bacterium]|nr:hypothetical protein [Candidatus Dormibacteraeota bacterium]
RGGDGPSLLVQLPEAAGDDHQPRQQDRQQQDRQGMHKSDPDGARPAGGSLPAPDITDAQM